MMNALEDSGEFFLPFFLITPEEGLLTASISLIRSGGR